MAAGNGSPPAAWEALRVRMAELADLGALGSLLFWDRSTKMPPRGAPARAEASATLERIHHQKLTDPDLGRLLDELEPWVGEQDPESDAVRLAAIVRRDFDKAVRVPSELAADLARAGALGEAAWLQAKAADDFSILRDSMERHVELRHRYVECFPEAEHPYDVLLDDFEPEMRTAVVRELFTELRAELVPLVARVGDPDLARHGGVLHGNFAQADQEAALLDVLRAFGFDAAGWRLDPAPHPFAQALSTGDVRITTSYDPHDLGVSFYSALHEFGHGAYDAGVDPALARSPLGETVSLGLHESQSRLWENALGRSRPFCDWVLPRLQAHLPDLAALTPERMHWGVNCVRPSRIRILADETTYNLHIILRFELEVALFEGTLEVADLPAAWNAKAADLLGVEVHSDREGLLQDIHWGSGLIGYFPTYSLGNLAAAQLWQRARNDLQDLDDQIRRGEFEPLLTWLRERVHRHGRRYSPAEVLRRATGEELAVAPFMAYLQAKLVDAGVVT